MIFHEYGKENQAVVCLVHAEFFRWDLFRQTVKSLADHFHVFVPELPGYDPKQPDTVFPGVEEAANQLEEALLDRGLNCLDGLYGFSMGAGIALCMLRHSRVRVRRVILESGLMPENHTLWPAKMKTWGCLCMLRMARRMKDRVCRQLWMNTSYTEAEMNACLQVMRSLNIQSLRNILYTQRKYPVPQSCPEYVDRVVYWSGSRDLNARKNDMKILSERFPWICVLQLYPLDRGELLMRQPKKFAEYLTAVIQRDDMLPE